MPLLLGQYPSRVCISVCGQIFNYMICLWWIKRHPISMNESYVSLSKLQEPCCTPLSIQIIWLLLWTSLSKCPGVLLWVNASPGTMLVAEDADAHANSTFFHQTFYMLMGINIYPHCIQILCLWNSMLLWANANVNSMSVAMGQHPSNDHICRYGPPHPNFQMYAYGLIINYPGHISS